MKYYKVTNYFGGINEIFDNYDEANALFIERMAKNDNYIELVEITCDANGYHGETIKVYNNGKYYAVEI